MMLNLAQPSWVWGVRESPNSQDFLDREMEGPASSNKTPETGLESLNNEQTNDFFFLRKEQSHFMWGSPFFQIQSRVPPVSPDRNGERLGVQVWELWDGVSYMFTFQSGQN